MEIKQRIGLFAGPLAFLAIYFFSKPQGLSEAGLAVLASTAWIAFWWVTEALPIAATALLPLVLFPLTGGSSMTDAVSGYSHPFIFLFIGGFILAIALEKWQLHKRIALTIIYIVGSKQQQIILGFMLATAFLSMWISNTATTVMMLPIGLAIIHQLKAKTTDSHFAKALLLGIAYSASIGGVATLIGTPPNLILAGVIEKTYGVEISFMQWLKLGLPFSILMLAIAWLYITRFAFSFEGAAVASGKQEIKDQLKALGKMSYEEKTVGLVFLLTAMAWVLRSYLLQPLIPAINDTIIAVIAALVLFMLPSSKRGHPLLHWEDAVKLPWGILLLFWGGISLASGFESSGLAQWIGSQFTALQGVSILLVLLVLIAAVNFLTEITSNIATTAVVLPILAPLALVIDVHPFVLMTSAAIAASCAFMLPVATAPNALVFSSKHLKMADMMRTGIWLNLLSIIVVTLLAFLLLPLLWELALIPHPAHLK